MQDKKNFGKYIAEKRKEANLTQEELANKLYVIPSTISKWERGITYPDITVIVNLCKELNISEHEFFTACDDENMNKEKREIERYRFLKKWLFNILNIGYLIGLLASFICDLAINHKLTWFLIVFVSILISFCITSLPFYLKKNKYIILKVSSMVTLLIYLLLFTINYVYNDTWLLGGVVIASFELLFIWLAILLCTFTKMSISYKASICLLLLAYIIVFTNPLCAKVLNIQDSDNNISNIISAVILIVVALNITIKKITNKYNN